MAMTIEATFDGQVFRPAEPISLPPNTTVRLTVSRRVARSGGGLGGPLVRDFDIG
jgi:hypothetical protein